MGGGLDGATAVVTGASSGIGAATARALAAEGAAVALLARRRDRLEELAVELGERASVHETDVTDEADVRASLEAVVATHGGIDVLVNNAGYGKIEPAADAGWASWKKVVKGTNVYAATKHAVGAFSEGLMEPSDVADAIVYAVTRPARVAVNEILIRPTGQTR